MSNITKEKLFEPSCAKQKQVLTSSCACPALQYIERVLRRQVVRVTTSRAPFSFPLFIYYVTITVTSPSSRHRGLVMSCSSYMQWQAWGAEGMTKSCAACYYPLFCLNWGRNTDRWCLKTKTKKLSLRFRANMAWEPIVSLLSLFFGSAAFRPYRHLNLWRFFLLLKNSVQK